MNVRYALLAAVLLIGLPVERALGVRTGTYTSNVSLVNSSPGTYFLGPGDSLFFSAGATVAVETTDPATWFYSRTWLIDEIGEVAFGVDDDQVQPGGTGSTTANAGYPVPQGGYNTYHGFSQVYYYEGETKVTLDYAYTTFSAD
jgi:hypothetical protein